MLITEIPKNVFVSGNFKDTGQDIEFIQSRIQSAGFNILVKWNESGLNISDYIEQCDIFITVLGLEDGAIRTVTGDTLPQMELNYAISERKKVIAIIKKPNVSSNIPRQEFFRNMIKTRLHDSYLFYESSSDLPNLCDLLIKEGFYTLPRTLKPYKAFISHSSKDKPKVEKIVQRLNQASILTFYDKHDIGVGMSLKKTIKKAITSVGYVVLCLSKNSIESKWVLDEIVWALEYANELGLEGDDFILPVRLETFEYPEKISFLKDIKYADFASDFETALANLIAALMK